MEIRRINFSDIEIISHLSKMQNDFRLDSINNAIIDRIVFEEGKPVAYGIVKKLAEAIILVDPSAPLLTRAKAMRELMQYAEYGAKMSNCEQLHCFVSDEKLAKSLEKHFGFIRSKDIVLVKNV
jgi:hypothetical protein